MAAMRTTSFGSGRYFGSWVCARAGQAHARSGWRGRGHRVSGFRFVVSGWSHRTASLIACGSFMRTKARRASRRTSTCLSARHSAASPRPSRVVLPRGPPRSSLPGGVSRPSVHASTSKATEVLGGKGAEAGLLRGVVEHIAERVGHAGIV